MDTAPPGTAEHTAARHVTIEPSILYFGTPVVLLTMENRDGSFNLAPMSSAWAARGRRRATSGPGPSS
ncbi:hypothetical protein GCM10022245_55230 [Streptomyces mayteni]